MLSLNVAIKLHVYTCRPILAILIVNLHAPEINIFLRNDIYTVLKILNEATQFLITKITVNLEEKLLKPTLGSHLSM